MGIRNSLKVLRGFVNTLGVLLIMRTPVISFVFEYDTTISNKELTKLFLAVALPCTAKDIHDVMEVAKNSSALVP